MFKTFAKAIQSLSVALLVGLPMAVSAQQLSENASIVVESPWARAPLVEVASSSVGMSRGRRLGTVEGARTARRFCASA